MQPGQLVVLVDPAVLLGHEARQPLALVDLDRDAAPCGAVIGIGVNIVDAGACEGRGQLGRILEGQREALVVARGGRGVLGGDRRQLGAQSGGRPEQNRQRDERQGAVQ